MTIDFSSQIKKIASLLAGTECALTLAGLTGSAPAYLLSRLLSEATGTFLIVTTDGDAAVELHRELCFYTGGDETLLHLPAWDTSPFETASPHPEVVGQRLNTLFRLMDGRARAVVAPLAAVVQKVLPRRTLGEVSQYLVAGEEVGR